jgi:biopolymer transport protein ExbD
MAFGSFDSNGSSQPMAEINTTPLVDVMLVLLVIFIITAPLFQQAVPVDLPRVDASRLDERAASREGDDRRCRCGLRRW